MFTIEQFCKAMPKIELHAHLNGSLSDSTLERLQKIKNKSETCENSNISKFKINKGQSRTLTECLSLFGIAQALTDTPETIKLAVALTLEEFDADNVVYLELRSTPRETPKMTKTEYIQSMVDAVLESKHLKMKTCIIVSIDRRYNIEQASQIIDVAIEMNKKYPNILIGLDLSGDPKVGNFQDFSPMFNEGRKAGLKVAIHAAEIPSEAETLQILNWKPERLGHMICISENHTGSTNLWNAVLESKIPIEIALTSNVKCALVTSYSDHHFKDLYETGHPISLATDDKGVFTTSLSEEYLICANTFQLDCNQLWQLAYDSIGHIFSDQSTKDCIKNLMLDFKSTMNCVF